MLKIKYKGNNQNDIQTRERLIQIIIIISGFFLAYSEKNERDLLVFPFILFIIFAILYYVTLTRSKSETSYLIDVYGFFSAYGFSLILLLFLNLKLTNPISGINLILLFITFTGVLTYGFISPNTNKKIDKLITKLDNYIELKYPKLLKRIFILLAILFLIYAIYNTIILYI